MSDPLYNENGIRIYNEDCLPAMKAMPDRAYDLAIVDPLKNGFQSFFNCTDFGKLALPETENFDSYFCHVRILRFIETLPFFLACIKRRIFGRVSVPIISVKLDDNIPGGDEGVNGEFSVDDMLRYKLNTKAIQNRIGQFFKFVWVGLRLFGSHFKQTCGKVWIFISTSHRAILSVVINNGCRRNLKFSFANLTYKGNLIASLPSIPTLHATRYGFIGPVQRDVKGLSALNTNKHFPGLHFVLWLMSMVAIRRAKLDSFCARFRYRNATSDTAICPDSIFHNQLLSQITAKHKPFLFYEWLLKNYAKPGDKILDTHGGSMSLAIACDIMGFELDCYEIDAEYCQAAIERLIRHRKQGVLEL